MPLFSVTRLTAKARPENERVRMNCSALASLGFPSLKAFTIRTCRRRTFRLAFDQLMVCQAIGLCRLVPAASKAAPNLRTPVYTLFSKLSRDERPLKSLLPFRPGNVVLSLNFRFRSSLIISITTPFQKLTPYPHNYSTAFAFSKILYPLIYRLPLRFGFHSRGDNRAYHVPHKYLSGDLGSTNRPTAQHLRQEKR